MEVNECLILAEKNKDYLAWKKQYPKSFFSYFFLENNISQVGFYNEKIDKVYSLKINNNEIFETWEDAVFRDPSKKIQPLSLETVKLTIQEVKTNAEGFFLEKYKTTPLLKTIYVLEKRDGHVVWAITFVTNSLFLITIKLDPNTGKILDEQKVQLTS